MVFHGFQKLTLLDFPGRVAATLFTAGCNFRCPFCHNASLVLRAGEVEEIPEKDLLSYLEKRGGLLDGVCITGGEPLLNPDIEELIVKIRSYGLLVKLDTNGYRPEVLQSLVEAGLVDYVAMDVKNSPSRYNLTAGVEGVDMEKIAKSIAK